MPKLLISAGESSGDQRAAALLGHLKSTMPDLEVFGMGGEALREAGCRIDVDSTHLDVMGFSDVIKRLPEFRGIMSRMTEIAGREKPDAALLCDYPGFNLRLSVRLKEMGIRTIFYVSPQVWAWKPGRVNRIARMVDKMLVIFPFERDLYAKAGLDVEFVGHPLADELPGDYPQKGRELKAELGISAEEELLALLPGSRPMELERHLETFAAASSRIRKGRPSVRPVLALTPAAPTEEIARRAGKAAGTEIPVVSGRTREVVAAARLAISVSGTATLETALLGCPMIVCYRAGWINYLLGRLLVTVPCISLPNVVSGAPTVPELYQTEVNPKTISDAALAILEDETGRQRMSAALSATRQKLGVHGASRRAAEAVAVELQKGS